MVKKIENSATYFTSKLDGTRLALPIARKRIKIVKRREKKNLKIEALDDEALSIKVEEE